MFEVLDSCLGSVFASGGNIHFGVLVQQRLHAQDK